MQWGDVATWAGAAVPGVDDIGFAGGHVPHPRRAARHADPRLADVEGDTRCERGAGHVGSGKATLAVSAVVPVVVLRCFRYRFRRPKDP